MNNNDNSCNYYYNNTEALKDFTTELKLCIGSIACTTCSSQQLGFGTSNSLINCQAGFTSLEQLILSKKIMWCDWLKNSPGGVNGLKTMTASYSVKLTHTNFDPFFWFQFSMMAFFVEWVWVVFMFVANTSHKRIPLYTYKGLKTSSNWCSTPVYMPSNSLYPVLNQFTAFLLAHC